MTECKTSGTVAPIVEEVPRSVPPREAPAIPPTRFEDVFGCLPWGGAPKTIEDMDEGVLREARRRAGLTKPPEPLAANS